MLRWHPDRGGDEERARLLNEAREYLVRHPDQVSPADRVNGLGCGGTAPAHGHVRHSSDAAPVVEPRAGLTLSGAVAMLALGYFILLGIAIVGWVLATILTMP